MSLEVYAVSCVMHAKSGDDVRHKSYVRDNFEHELETEDKVRLIARTLFADAAIRLEIDAQSPDSTEYVETKTSEVFACTFLPFSSAFGFAQSLMEIENESKNVDVTEENSVFSIRCFLSDVYASPRLFTTDECANLSQWLKKNKIAAERIIMPEMWVAYNRLLKAADLGANNGYMLFC